MKPQAPSGTSQARQRRAFTFPELILCLTLILLMTLVMLPQFVASREAARRSQCQSNLHQLGTALQLYAADTDGRFPPVAHDWNPVLTTYVKNEAVPGCPSDPEAKATAAAPRPSYQYRPGLTLEGRSSEPLARDWAAWHHHGVNTLFLDTRVRWEATPPVPLLLTDAPRPSWRSLP
ncbi:MAG: DUF1559 domain-containing protein [Armatimonadetes bacterium]|nr:DUF1559 domain-containing protein [Armatimonadota bacterium]